MVIQKPVTIDVIRTELKNLDSKLELLQERLNTIENTQDVIGRTIINVNQKLKDVEAKIENTGFDQTSNNQTQNTANNELYVTKEEFKKLKYTLEMINPLEFATLSQVKDLIKDLKTQTNTLQKEDKSTPKEINFENQNQ